LFSVVDLYNNDAIKVVDFVVVDNDDIGGCIVIDTNSYLMS